MKCPAGWSTSWNQAQARRNINNLRYADDTALKAEREEELKSLSDEGERREWNSWLKSQHSEN